MGLKIVLLIIIMLSVTFISIAEEVESGETQLVLQSSIRQDYKILSEEEIQKLVDHAVERESVRFFREEYSNYRIGLREELQLYREYMMNLFDGTKLTIVIIGSVLLVVLAILGINSYKDLKHKAKRKLDDFIRDSEESINEVRDKALKESAESINKLDETLRNTNESINTLKAEIKDLEEKKNELDCQIIGLKAKIEGRQNKKVLVITDSSDTIQDEIKFMEQEYGSVEIQKYKEEFTLEKYEVYDLLIYHCNISENNASDCTLNSLLKKLKCLHSKGKGEVLPLIIYSYYHVIYDKKAYKWHVLANMPITLLYYTNLCLNTFFEKYSNL